MSADKGNISEIPHAKFLLILGVVAIHCSYLSDNTATSFTATARNLMSFFSDAASGCCVPAFFILSGFLFFRGGRPEQYLLVSSESFSYYRGKFSRRMTTLLVPYLLWNLIASLIFLAKVFLGVSPGYGVLEGGDFSIVRYLCGFVDLAYGLPYDFPLWFLRNLILMVAISPLIALFAREWMTMLLVIIWLIFSDESFLWCSYFCIGAFIGMRPRLWKLMNTKFVYLLALIVFAAAVGFIYAKTTSGVMLNLLINLRNFTAVICAVAIGGKLQQNGVISRLAPATFFIFAFHGFFVSPVRIMMLRLFGSTTTISGLLCYVATFLTLVAISTVTFMMLRKFFPRATSVFSGGRI